MATKGDGTAQHQRELFDARVDAFTQPQPQEVEDKLCRIASSAPLTKDSRVLDVGSGTGCLIPHYQSLGVADILAVDLSPNMLAALEQRFGKPPTAGNTKAVRTWLGDICELPNHQGRANAIFMNSVFGNLPDQHAALLKCCTLLNPEGYIIISHPLGRKWLAQLHQDQPDMVPNLLPDKHELARLVSDLPLEIADFSDEEEYYCAVLRIPRGFTFPGAPVKLEGPVVTGFQRGSKQMGVPTANVAPLSVQHQLEGLPKGVYFGWAQVRRAGHERVAKMVMNYGVRPTIKDGSHVTVEAHIMDKYADDFYGETLRLLVTGFVRPEMSLGSLDALIDRINTDIGIATSQLDLPDAASLKDDAWFDL